MTETGNVKPRVRDGRGKAGWRGLYQEVQKSDDIINAAEAPLKILINPVHTAKRTRPITIRT
jgi:hypothetical protein